MFPDHTTPDRLFNGVRFADIPICKIKTTPNNTIIHTIKAHGNKTLAYRSCGMEGFKNTRKGTNIAAQATAITHSNVSMLGICTFFTNKRCVILTLYILGLKRKRN